MATNVTTNIDASYITEPVNKNFLKPNGFRMLVTRLPGVQYFCQASSLPKVTLGAARQPTPLADVQQPGDKVDFDTLTVTFLIDEDMTNYNELFSWIMGLGFPQTHNQFAELTSNPAANITASSKMLETSQFSDIVVFILDSASNPIAQITYHDAFPIALEGLDFDVRIPTVEYFTGIATFGYTTYDITPVNSSVVSLV